MNVYPGFPPRATDGRPLRGLKMKTLFLRFAKDTSGVTVVEGGLVASLVAVVLVGGISLLRMKV